MLSLTSDILVCLSLLRAATSSAHLRVAFMWGWRKRVTAWPWAYIPYSYSQGAEAIVVNWRSPGSIWWGSACRWAYLPHSILEPKKQAPPRIGMRRISPTQTKSWGWCQTRRQPMEGPKINKVILYLATHTFWTSHFWKVWVNPCVTFKSVWSTLVHFPLPTYPW